MPCPYCNAYNYIPEVVDANIRAYTGNSVLSATLCCSKPVIVVSEVKVYGVKVDTHKPEDDWGIAFKK